jgi:hypothetical protein
MTSPHHHSKHVTHVMRAMRAMRVLAAGDALRVLVVQTDQRTFATTLRRLWGRVSGKRLTNLLARRGTVNRGTIETKEIGSC